MYNYQANSSGRKWQNPQLQKLPKWRVWFLWRLWHGIYYQHLYQQNNCGKGKNISTENIVPIFTTNNLDEVTKVVDGDCDIWFAIDMMTGTEISACPRPCTTTFTDTMLTRHEPSVKSTIIVITFDNNILVTRIKVDIFRMMQSLNYLGSELGLWPGLGIFQLIQWLFKNFSWGMLLKKMH